MGNGSSEKQSGERISSLDTFRAVGIYYAVLIHCCFFCSIQSLQGIGVISVALCRFVIPYFFMVSGFLLHKSYEKTNNIKEISFNAIKRIIIIYLFWSAFYVVFHFIEDIAFGMYAGENLDYLALFIKNFNRHISISKLFLSGTDQHFWFLPALLYSFILGSIAVRIKKEKWLLVISIVLYIIGVFGQSYQVVIENFFVFPYNTRDGITFGLMFFMSGYLLYNMKTKRPWLFLLISFIGLIVQSLEMFFLYSYKAHLVGDFMFGTAAYGIGFFIYVINKPEIGKKHPFIQKIGSLTLGIYCIHFYFVKLLLHAKPLFNPLLWELIFTPASFFTTIAVVFLLYRFNKTRRLVA